MTNIKENILTKEFVKDLFDYKDGHIFWKKEMGSRAKVGEQAGSFDISMCYFRTKINGKSYLNHRIIFLLHNGFLPKFVDHKDRDSTNNFPHNLREASHSQNSANRRAKSTGSSKYLGVYYLARNGKYFVSIKHNGKIHYLGLYLSEENAALAYNKAAVKHHGEFANLNIINLFN